MNGHRGPVSALALDYDEKGFFSAGWDGEAIVGSSPVRRMSLLTLYNSNGISIQVKTSATTRRIMPS